MLYFKANVVLPICRHYRLVIPLLPFNNLNALKGVITSNSYSGCPIGHRDFLHGVVLCLRGDIHEVQQRFAEGKETKESGRALRMIKIL